MRAPPPVSELRASFTWLASLVYLSPGVITLQFPQHGEGIVLHEGVRLALNFAL
jgi:hypothetical protein